MKFSDFHFERQLQFHSLDTDGYGFLDTKITFCLPVVRPIQKSCPHPH